MSLELLDKALNLALKAAEKGETADPEIIFLLLLLKRGEADD